MNSCDYCALAIEKHAPGWGYYISEQGELVFFHSECAEITEGVVIGI